jgi:hypothetical protein
MPATTVIGSNVPVVVSLRLDGVSPYQEMAFGIVLGIACSLARMCKQLIEERLPLDVERWTSFDGQCLCCIREEEKKKKKQLLA